jgi:hypothetical protein
MNKKIRGSVLAALLTLAIPVLDAQVSAPDLKWHKDLKGQVDEAIVLVATDPVSASLVFKELLAGTIKKPTAEQRVWLEGQIAALQPKVAEILQGDYDRAARAGDLRGAILAAAAAERLGSANLRKEPTVAEIQKRVAAEAPNPGIWKVTEVTASSAKGYSESGLGFSVIVRKGMQVLRVKARAENISAEPDAGYLLAALGPQKRFLGKIRETTGPRRWIDHELLCVIGDDGAFLPCVAIAQGTDLGWMQIRTGGDRLMYPPVAVAPSGSVLVDAIFVVPLEAKKLRLLVLGAAPVELEPKPAQK